jgi:hypothetical protein
MNSLSVSSVSPNHERSQHFLALLGKKPATTCLRAVYPKGHAKLTEPKRDRGRKHPCWDSAQVERWQREGLNVYVVINDGGQSDQSISSCRALFCEWDNREKDWQLTAWQELGLPEPTLQVDSGGRSIHSYWVFEEPIEPSCWRDLQARLLAHTGSDLTLKNPSRVMRLPGCYYLKAPQDVQPPVMTEIVSEAGVRYTAEQLEQVLPPLVEGKAVASEVAASAAGDTATTSHQPRDLADIKAALSTIPAAVPDTGQYPMYRNLLWGLIDACRQVGADVEVAKAMLREHSPQFKELDQVAASSCDKVTAGTFWYHAQQAGWKPRPVGSHATSGKGKEGKKEKVVCQRLGPAQVRELLLEKLGLVRLNVRTRSIHLPDAVLSGDDASRLYLKLSTEEISWPKETTYDALIYHAHRSPFDPALEDLNRLVSGVRPLPQAQWQRLDQLLLGIDDPVAAAFLPRYLVAAVARLHAPGCDVHQSPVLIGPQGIGKSRLGRVLFGEAHYGDQLSNKLDVDDVTRMQRFWCLELAELDGITRRSDLEAFKAFMTRTVDVERRKYGRSEEAMPRRTVFWGTSNSSPLRDPSGARRFVCIPLAKQPLPVAQVEVHRAAIWAKAVEQYHAGMSWWSTPEEAAQIEERNGDHQQVDPWVAEVEEIVAREKNRYAAIKQPATKLHVTNEVIHTHLEIPKSQLNNHIHKRIRQIMEGMGWHWRRVIVEGKEVRCWLPGC